MKTAVSWLEVTIKAMLDNGGDLGEDYPALIAHIQQAKEMENKQRIMDYEMGYINGGNQKNITGEQYLNE